MTGTLAGRTEWERRQYERDHGRRAAMALGLRLAAEFTRHDESGPLPAPFTVYAPVTTGTEDERTAAVDAWAQAHHVPAGWDEDHHHYCAKLSFGPLTWMVYMMPDRREVPAPVPAEVRPELATAGRDAA